jgi:hypothetical protein
MRRLASAAVLRLIDLALSLRGLRRVVINHETFVMKKGRWETLVRLDEFLRSKRS